MTNASDNTQNATGDTPTASGTPIHLVIMGVSGSGKTTLARILGERTGRPVLEADDLHPAENLAALGRGDLPKEPSYVHWLEDVRDWMSDHGKRGISTIVACPALTRAHRDVLNSAEGITFFVHLYGTFDVLSTRMGNRIGGDMPQELLVSQLEVLERLYSDELGIQLDVTRTPDELVDDALSAAKFAEAAYGKDSAVGRVKGVHK